VLPMSYLVSLKVVRLLLAVSVAIWLAGGCLLGCGNAAMAATGNAEKPAQTAVEGESCDRTQAHHCCSKAKPAKANPAKRRTIDPKLTEALMSLNSVPRGMMSDCPLAVNATAVTSKQNSNAPDLAHATTAALPPIADKGELPREHFSAPQLPNRGPTYLRCCVFLI
jgi:hypothetical protein